MNAFSKLHPITKGAFFICAFVLVLSASSPVFSAVSLCAALLFTASGSGRAFFNSLKFSLVVTALVSVFNMLFAHYGSTVLFTLGYTDFTLEALFYGFNQGMVMASVMLWFRTLSYVQDSYEVMYLMRFTPKLALLFSMVLGFIPRFTRKLDDIRTAQKGLNPSEDRGVKEKFNSALHNLSALITYSLESSIITADSMNARGFKNSVPVLSRYRFTKRDLLYFLFVLIIFSYLVFIIAAKRELFIFEPRIYFKSHSILAEILFAAVMLLPVIIEEGEVLLWKRAQSKS